MNNDDYDYWISLLRAAVIVAFVAGVIFMGAAIIYFGRP
jgi:hypothetical protein